LVFFPVALVAACLVFSPALLAQPAPQPGASEKVPAKKSKTKEKQPQPRVEGSHSSEAEARKACAEGSVVWVNSRSKVFHASGTRDYGKTRQGFYMCQPQAERAGFRPVKGSPKGKKKDSKA
jgi:hypothetical protein